MKKGILEKIYGENTIIGIIIIALSVFFGKIIFPEKIAKIEPYLIPAFIVIMCIEVLFIRRKLTNELSEIKKNTSIQFKIEAFKTGEEFDNWLENVLKKSNFVKVAHLSSFSSSPSDKVNGGDKRKGRKYNNLISDFVNSGKTFHRVFCNTDNEEVFDWIVDELKKHEEHRYFISFMDKVTVSDVKNISILIIDNKYVCLGGGYRTRFNRPTIVIENKEIVDFYTDYFNHLTTESKSINLGGKIDYELLKNQKEKMKKANSNRRN